MTLELFEETIRRGPYEIRFPSAANLAQDEEWCEVRINGKWRRIRFHDYHEVYEIPGLYETIFYRTLKCVSPNQVVNLLSTVIGERRIDPCTLRALDFGAGNGIAGEALQTMGVRRIIGADILPEAKAAAERDRPWVYDNYIVEDFRTPSGAAYGLVRSNGTNLLTAVAALGFGDIPVSAFYHAFNMIDAPGWLAMNIKADFIGSSIRSGFSGLLNRMYEQEILQCEMYKRYCHRLSVNGEPLDYVALVAKKRDAIPQAMLDEVRDDA